MPFQKATMRSNTYIPLGSPELIKQKKNFGNSLENPKFFFYFMKVGNNGRSEGNMAFERHEQLVCALN